MKIIYGRFVKLIGKNNTVSFTKTVLFKHKN